MATQSVRIGWRPYVNLNTATYLVDTYSGSTAVYSLRKVNSAYTGSAIRVRRSNDNSEKNINFTSNGDLDTNALLDFVGYPNAFLLGSETLSTNTAFQGTGLTITGNWLTGPDGVTPGNKLTETATNNYHNTSYSILSGTNATMGTHNFSGYLKKGTGSAAPDRIAVGVGNSTYYMYAIFNLSTGTIETQNYSGTVTNYSAQMTDAGNGWYRCSVGGVLNFPGTQSVQIRFLFVNNSASYNPFTGSWYVGNVNADVQVTQVMWIKEAGLQRYGKTLTSGGGTQGGGFVTTWYDQSGLARHSTQVTAASQPYIVSNGSLILRSGKPAIYFDGVDDTLRLSTPLPVSDITTLFTVAFANYENSSNDIVLGRRSAMSYRFSGGNGPINGLCITRAEAADFIYAGTPAGTTGLNTLATFHTHYAFGNYDGLNRTRIYSNGVWRNDANGVGTSGFSQVEYIGSMGDGQWFKNTIQELVYYPSNQLNNRIAIENNINSYYSLWDRTAVVSNGLVLNLDASDINSYFKTGTEWYNIAATSSIVKGTLVNGPVFATASGGSILFDGVNDYVNLGSNFRFNDTDITYDFWFKVTDNSDVYREIITLGSANQSNVISLWKFRSGSNSGKVFANIYIAGFTQTLAISQLTGADILNTIVNYSAVFKKESGVYKLYLYRNGVLDASTTSNVTSYNMNNWANFEARIGSGSSTYPELWKGNIYSGKVYNRALSDTEILQNFNLTKSRFGL
jgi:hypothetical protein